MTTPLPEGFHSQLVDLGGIEIHVVHNGERHKADGPIEKRGKPALLLLHGFPEYWAAWKPLIPYLAEQFLMIMPDQRGYNLSAKPQAVADYKTSKLVSDMIGLMTKLLPGQPFNLVGHDWGASVAYALAIGRPDLIEKLVIVNGAHPVTFQRALLYDPAQSRGSQYIHRLRADDSHELMSKNNYEKSFGMLEKFSDTRWLTEQEREGYLAAWSQPGAMNAMLNWYRATPLAVPSEEDPHPQSKILETDPSHFKVSMPHLVIWGMDDPALQPASRDGLEEFAADLTIVEVDGADHWIIHQKPELVAREMRKFLF